MKYQVFIYICFGLFVLQLEINVNVLASPAIVSIFALTEATAVDPEGRPSVVAIVAGAVFNRENGSWTGGCWALGGCVRCWCRGWIWHCFLFATEASGIVVGV